MPQVDETERYWEEFSRRQDAAAFKGVSLSVTEAYMAYSKYATTETFVDRANRAKRSAQMLNDFFPNGEMNSTATMAAQLWELVGKPQGGGSANTTAEYRAINTFLGIEYADFWSNEYIASTPTEDVALMQGLARDEAGYIAELLMDKSQIANFWQEKFPKLYAIDDAESTDEASNNASRRKHLDILQNVGTGRVGQKTWLANPAVITNTELREFADTVQIESILITATQLLDAIKYPHKLATQKELFRLCILAEGYIAPICEVLGFDRLSDALLNVSVQTRFKHAGREDLINEAKKYDEMLGTPEELEQNLHDFVTNFGGEIISKRALTENEANYGVFSREYRVRDAEGKEFYVIMRVKTIGSRAQKILKGKKVSDLVAFSFITDEDDPAIDSPQANPNKTDPHEQMKQVWNHLLQKGLEGGFAFKPSSSRAKFGWWGAIAVEGTSKFVKEFRRASRSVFGHAARRITRVKKAEEELAKDSDDFHAAKITGTWRRIPCEVQVKTHLMRRSERDGKANHRRAKIGDKYNDDWDNLPLIHERAESMGHIELLKGTGSRGQDYLRKLKSPLAAEVGLHALQGGGY